MVAGLRRTEKTNRSPSLLSKTPMPRSGRLIVPRFPHHLLMRGHNREVVFHADEDYQFFLATLSEFSLEYAVLVHSFCLLPNHAHLLVTPQTPDGVAQLVKRIAGRQTRYVNRRIGRSGTLWEGRYRSSPVQPERYFYPCRRFIERHPVRAGLVEAPGDYRWSSYLVNVNASRYAWLTTKPLATLDAMSHMARNEYVRYVNSDEENAEVGFIRSTLNRCQLTGDSAFVDRVEVISGHRVEPRAPGRPRTIKLF